jgi:hypothetical protein
MADDLADQVATVSVSETTATTAVALPDTWNDQLKDESGEPLSKR